MSSEGISPRSGPLKLTSTRHIFPPILHFLVDDTPETSTYSQRAGLSYHSQRYQDCTKGDRFVPTNGIAAPLEEDMFCSIPRVEGNATDGGNFSFKSPHNRAVDARNQNT